MEITKIIVAVGIRLFSGIAGYFTVLSKLIADRKHTPPELKGYNTKLIISVSCFIITCFGTAFFQACLWEWIPQCRSNFALSNIAIFNSLGLFAAWYVMTLMVNYKPPVVEPEGQIADIQDDVKEIKKDVKAVRAKQNLTK